MEGDDVAPTSTRVSPAKSASNPNGAKSKKHDCGFCGRSFARFEHLQRHEKIHTNEKPFTCLQCPKSFARKDLLVRHRKVIHEATESAQPQFQGSKYPLPEAPADAQALRQSRTRQIKKARLVLDGPSTTDLGIDISEEDQNHFQAEGGAVPSLGQPELHPFEGVSQDCAHPTQPNVPADPNALEEIAVHSLEPSGYSVLNHDDNTPESSGEGLFNSIWDAQLFDLPWLDSFDLSMTAFPSAVHTAQPLWPMPHNSPAPFSQSRQRQQQRQRPNADSIAENVDQTLSAPSSQSNPKNPAHGRLFAPSLHSRIFSRRPSPEPQKSLPISPLTPRTSSRIATKVRIRLNGQLEPLLPLLPSGFVLPSQYALGRYVSSYFDGFHLHLPLLHVPTWSPESCHVGLLIAMCALGAKYSFEKDIAMALWKAGRLVVRMATEERREILEEHRSVDMEICQAMLLLMAFQTWTGDKFLLRQAFSFQSTLANLVRQDSPKSPSQLEEMSWEEWIDYEGSKRTKLVIYCFFNLQYLTYNVPPLLLNREIALDLPSDEESWRAEDENLWRQNGRGQVSGTPPFQVALRKLLLESGSSSGTRSFQDPPPPPQDTSPYSTFGSYVLIHGLIQHHFQLRQYSGFTLAADSTLPLHQVRPIEHGLRSWQQAWEKSPEASLDPRNPHGPVAFNCTALLRMAYIRLEIDFGPACTALQSGDPHAIARAIRDQCTVSRGPRLTRAALHSCHALLILVKEGIDLVAHTQVFVWSIVHSVASFHCCLVLVKWLDAVTANAPDQPLSEEEKWLVKLVQETLQECNTGEVWDVKTLSVSVLRAWAKVFNGTTIWGIMPAMGEAFKIYANMLSGSELTDPGL